MYITIDNFQIIDHAEIELTPGMTVLVGPTDSGKSAIFRAIKSAVFNASGTDFIQQGQNKAEVKFEFDGNEIVWEKDAKSSSPTTYYLNGQTLTKVGRTQVDEVADLIRLKEIELARSKEPINFWEQMTPPFLMDKTPAQLFEFMSISSEEQNLSDILREMRSDSNSISKDVTKVEGSIETLTNVKTEEEEFLNSLEGFDDLFSEILDLEDEVVLYSEVSELVTEIRKIESAYADSKQKSDSLTQTLTKKITPVYDITDTMIDDYSELETLTTEIDTITTKKAKMEKQIKTIDNISKQVDIADIKTRISQLDKQEQKKQSLAELVTEADTLSSKISQTLSSLSDTKEALEDTEKELTEFDVCPFCGSRLKGDNDGCKGEI